MSELLPESVYTSTLVKQQMLGQNMTCIVI